MDFRSYIPLMTAMLGVNLTAMLGVNLAGVRAQNDNISIHKTSLCGGE